MIKSFRDKATAAVFMGVPVRHLPPTLRQRMREKLDLLHAAEGLQDLRAPPANRLEALRGSRQGQWSIRINDQWRLCFIWANGHAWDAEIVDYH